MLGNQDLVVSLLQSDLLQQLFRFPRFRAYKTGLDNRFRCWHKLLLNAVMALGRRLGSRTVFVPAAGTVLQRTARRVDPALFRRIYDHPPSHYCCHRAPLPGGEYWAIDVPANRGRIAELEPVSTRWSTQRTICLMHDIEGNVDTDIAPSDCERNLGRMLAIEKAAGIRGTYNILGTQFPQAASIVAAAGGHALGFHSYNHRIEDENQLPQVRRVNLQVKGYRPPRSVLTAELSADRLHHHNFEWLASSRASLGFDGPRIERGVARLPIATDDYPLHCGTRDFDSWSAELLRRARETEFLAFSVHDCYASHWLDGFERLLRTMKSLGGFRTADEVSADLFLRSSATI
jgi:hypothetical protein